MPMSVILRSPPLIFTISLRSEPASVDHLNILYSPSELLNTGKLSNLSTSCVESREIKALSDFGNLKDACGNNPLTLPSTHFQSGRKPTALHITTTDHQEAFITILCGPRFTCPRP
ncbi:hypothetical protein AQUCO_11500012v1 [Aquilegia coerulea]|uniref:Uncharacterized protein n=1 Tax=Aquilegia coerulea TaxID=218851 RepID=A0A2G5C2E2_AQUCA|nr:hypothetical protein AQUCO_11500012v1 [Aquilegia coerulea]